MDMKQLREHARKVLEADKWRYRVAPAAESFCYAVARIKTHWLDKKNWRHQAKVCEPWVGHYYDEQLTDFIEQWLRGESNKPPQVTGEVLECVSRFAREMYDAESDTDGDIQILALLEAAQ